MKFAEQPSGNGRATFCVRYLGGSLLRCNRDARLFQFARRLLGLRTKITVLLAAEVVGLCYYQSLVELLPMSRVRSLLAQIVNDECAHLNFHCRFLRARLQTPLQRLLFTAAWRSTLLAATAVVLVDHRHALRDLKLPGAAFRSQCKAQGRLVERRVFGQEATVNGLRLRGEIQ